MKKVKNPDNQGQVTKVIYQVAKDFSLAPAGNLLNLEQLQILLKDQIQHLIDHDLERLMNGLYRIDVDEYKVKEAFADETQTADLLASLVIQRELEKIISRRKYSSGG